MAIHSRRQIEESEEESVFISMTDLMISILFIIMILMAYFSLRIDPDIQMVEKSKYEKVRLDLEVAEELIKIKDDQIKQQGVEIDRLKDKISDLESIIRSLNKDLENIKIKLDQEIDKNTDYREKIIILKQRLEDNEKNLETIKNLERQVVLLNLQVESLSNTNKDLRNQLKGTVPKELLADQEVLITNLRMTITKLSK